MLHRSAEPSPAQQYSPLRVDLCTEADACRWNAFLDTAPDASFYHRYEWAQLNARELKAAPHYLIARRGPDIEGVLPLAFIASPWFGRILCSMPYVNYGGPCTGSDDARAALVDAAIKLAVDLNAKYLELRTRRTVTQPLPVSLRKLSLTLALDKDPEALWKAFSSKHRTNIRRAEKNELLVRSGGLGLLPTFYAVMEQSWRSLGTPLYRERYFRAILDAFPEHTRIFVCSQRDQPIAVAFNGYFNGVVEGMWAGGGPRARELQANYVLYWEMIRDACTRGFRTYHLGRSTADSGAEDFKKKWNAEAQQLYWYYARPDGGPIPELNVANPKYQMAIKAWRRLPLQVTRLLGPPLARAIP